MTTEIEPKNPYAAVLADLRAKRAEIDNTIRILEAMSGLKLTETSVGAHLAPTNVFQADAPDEDPANDAGLFLGMSIADATKKLLAMRKRAMGNPEISRELAAGGLALTSADPVNVVGSVLTRRFNQVGDIVKISRGTWGLKEWYPNRTFKPSGKQGVTSEPKRDDDDDSPLTPNKPIDQALEDLIGGPAEITSPEEASDGW